MLVYPTLFQLSFNSLRCSGKKDEIFNYVSFYTLKYAIYTNSMFNG